MVKKKLLWKLRKGGERGREVRESWSFFILSSLGDTKLQNSHGANFWK